MFKNVKWSVSINPSCNFFFLNTEFKSFKWKWIHKRGCKYHWCHPKKAIFSTTNGLCSKTGDYQAFNY